MVYWMTLWRDIFGMGLSGGRGGGVREVPEVVCSRCFRGISQSFADF